MTKIIILFWPLLVSILAYFYKKKQNGDNPFTGGPISTPKAFWLAYTVSTWFFFPLIFVFNPLVSPAVKLILAFHLLSWWIRGPLELVMIYKWFNWSPCYGITHDIFHLISLISLIIINYHEIQNFGPINIMAITFVGMTIIATLAEILFAYLFFTVRSKEEEKENIYFASDDPKWIFINRLTFIVVCSVMIHLTLQAVYAFFML